MAKNISLSLQDVDEALRRLPQEEVDARTQRLKLAMDLSLKHVYLPKEMQAVQTPYNSYVMVSASAAQGLCKTCLSFSLLLPILCPNSPHNVPQAWIFFVQDAIEQVEAENKEKAQLCTGTTYDRSIP